MTTKFESANYYQFSTSINTLLATGLYSAVKITIYNDQAGSVIHTTNNGVILDNKEIIHLKKRDPYIDANTNQTVDPYIQLEFTDSNLYILLDGATPAAHFERGSIEDVQFEGDTPEEESQRH